ncbi:hypothetical protein EGT07_26095 [Herbaspirillum sp. HC18]|nr:hypothetical protein EGT07_26095 [Herbaspirillum sp. HC18]
MRRLLMQQPGTAQLEQELLERSAKLQSHAFRPDVQLPPEYEVVTHVAPDGQVFKIVGERMPGDPSRFLAKNPKTGETLCTLKRMPAADGGVVWMHPESVGLHGGAPPLSLDDMKERTWFHGDVAGVRDLLELRDCRVRRLSGLFDPEDVPAIARSTLQTVNTMEKDTCHFLNSYSPLVWVMQNNWRNGEKCSFYMSDIVHHQAQIAGSNGARLKYLVRHQIASETGKAFLKRNQFESLAKMTRDQLDEFMTTTVNGKSSKRILDRYGLIAVDAQVLFNEFSCLIHGEDANPYSVILKVVPSGSN